MQEIPEHLYRDRYWKSMLYLFSKHAKLNCYFTTQYFDFTSEQVKIPALKNLSKPWFPSERFMLNLAFHLYNPSNKVDLSEMDRLDPINTSLALKAIELRYA